VRASPRSRAIAGNYLGGDQALSIVLANPGMFGSAAVLTSGIYSAFRPGVMKPNWEERNRTQLDNPSLRKNLKLAWFAVSKDDGDFTNISNESVGLLRQHQWPVEVHESAGKGEWSNWRDYMALYLPRLFQ
jgi:enterochelin esterase family protein